MNAEDIQRGQRVLVTYDSEHRDDKEAIVREVPPWTEKVAGETHERTDSVLVHYPNTSIDGGNLFGDMQERIPIDRIESV